MGSPIGGYPCWAAQPGFNVITFRIDGSEVASAAGTTDGLDARGKAFCTISDAGGDDQTIVFNRKFSSIPYVIHTPETANGAANITVSTSGIVLAGVERDDNTAGLADNDWTITVIGYTEAMALDN